MSEYSEVWITSNQEAPLYIKPGDRRQLIFKASELLQQNEQFFKKTTEQVQNINIQRAWFDFFMTRDITHFSPSKDPPNNTKSQTIQSCMAKTHRFFASFFQESDWYRRYKPTHQPTTTWFTQFFVKKRIINPRKGEVCLRIACNRLYFLYRAFMKELYPSSSIRDTDTFFKEAELVGITKRDGRQKIHSSCTTVCDVYYGDWCLAMGTLYQGFKFVEWAHTDPQFQTDMKEITDGGGGSDYDW